MMKLDEAVKLVKACDVKRWTIVPVTREQSIAEHSYRVWALALSLYDAMMTTNHNSFERESVGFWALTHDTEEIWTGDLPSTVKAVLEEIAPGVIKRLKERVLGDNMPGIAAAMRGLENTFAAQVVKIAECVEALSYYDRYSYNMRDRATITGFLRENLEKALVGAERKYPNAGITNVSRSWVAEALEKI